MVPHNIKITALDAILAGKPANDYASDSDYHFGGTAGIKDMNVWELMCVSC